MSMITRTTVRWTDQEFLELRKFADSQSITLSAAIRQVVLKNIPSAIARSRTPWLY